MSFGLGMQQPAPYIDDDGIRYYNLRQAARIVEGVCEKTLWNWAAQGVTSFGFELQVKRQPMIHDPKGYRHDAFTHRESRMLIPEERVITLKEILQAGGRTEPGVWTHEEMDRLEVIAQYRKRRAASLLSAKHP
jgi:hypothetical protein